MQPRRPGVDEPGRARRDAGCSRVGKLGAAGTVVRGAADRGSRRRHHHKARRRRQRHQCCHRSRLAEQAPGDGVAASTRGGTRAAGI